MQTVHMLCPGDSIVVRCCFGSLPAQMRCLLGQLVTPLMCAQHAGKAGWPKVCASTTWCSTPQGTPYNRLTATPCGYTVVPQHTMHVAQTVHMRQGHTTTRPQGSSAAHRTTGALQHVCIMHRPTPGLFLTPDHTICKARTPADINGHCSRKVTARAAA